MRVLLVEDAPGLGEAVREQIADDGHAVDWVQRLDHARNSVRSTPYDLILLDLQMPVMDGFQVLEGLKANNANDYVPVLVITAQPGHKVRALQAGAKDFVSKPFDLVEVKTRIHNLLEVRLLYQRLANQNKLLEAEVLERTAELRESEARYRSLTELATDWYWEQDSAGHFTKVSGPVLEMLGIRVDALVDSVDGAEGAAAAPAEDGWDEAQRQALQDRITARTPFLDVQLDHVSIPLGRLDGKV